MDAGKRAKGDSYVRIARLLPSAVRPISTYEEFVCVFLNMDYIRIANIVDMADAVEIGFGRARVPDDWIRLLSSNDEERGKWLMREIRKELFG